MTRHVVATVDEVPPGGRKRVTVAGRDIALFRLGEEYLAIQDRCPHEGASLCAGQLTGLVLSDRPGHYELTRQGEILRCPWHGWEFDIRTGRSWCDPERMRVRSFPTMTARGAELEDSQDAETFPVTIERDYVLVEIAAPAIHDAVVAQRRVLAERIVLLEIARADGGALPGFVPGAHADLHLSGGLVRPYSLVGEPEADGRWRIAVLLEAASRGGSAAVHALHEGDALRVGSPRSHFALVGAAKAHCLIAGGIGITPLLGMATRLARLGEEFVLHYCVRSGDTAAFLPDLRAGAVAPHLRLHDAAEGGRLDIAAALAANPEAEIYVCGPQRLVDAVSAAHAALGLPPVRLHVERFAAEVATGGAPFTIEARRSGRVLDIPADRSAAEVLVEAGIPVPLSCEQGVCGSCVTTVLAGEPEHRDSVLTAEEKAANRQIALCCSRARSGRLVLDI
ncbi:Rieske 2Fe-2S domain-containing protein [Falsiroseomonas sp. HW251]|uniref:Rieske 2Fe-2S domain-containing protein n=1 Tax=Falsiroseomonas sp. HW251 TaxID=3390998 RepID=UPI003D31641F